MTAAKSFMTRAANEAMRLDRARASQGSRSTEDRLRTRPWKLAMSARASTSDGTPSSIAATVNVSDLDKPSRPMLKRRAVVRAEGVRPWAPAAALAARRRRVAHSVTARKDPRNPGFLHRRHSSAPFRQPADHGSSSHGRWASSELSRVRNMSARWPRGTWRTRPRLGPVRHPISLIGRPSFLRPRMAVLAASRRRKPSCWSSSAATVAAPTTPRICRIDVRPASRKARLAFSLRCQPSATWVASGKARATARAYPPPRSPATMATCGWPEHQSCAVAGSRSGSRAMVLRRARSQMMVPERRFRRHARKVVDADHSRRDQVRAAAPPRHAQKAVLAHKGQPQPRRQAGRWPSAERARERVDKLIEPGGSPGPRRQHLRVEALGEDAPATADRAGGDERRGPKLAHGDGSLRETNGIGRSVSPKPRQSPDCRCHGSLLDACERAARIACARRLPQLGCRSGRNAALSSAEKSSGCSHAAKCPPLGSRL